MTTQNVSRPLLLVCRDAMTEGEDEDAIDTIYRTIDKAMRDGRMMDVDLVLWEMHPKVSVVRALAFLSITLPAKAYLPSRKHYADRVSAFLRRVDPDRHDELLAGIT
jgi:hypothetical protein